MFATLSSFLPSALQQGSPNPANTPSKDFHPPHVKAEDPKPKDVIVDESSIKRKEKRANHEVRLGHTSPLPILTSICT
jgi:hypothetical protein